MGPGHELRRPLTSCLSPGVPRLADCDVSVSHLSAAADALRDVVVDKISRVFPALTQIFVTFSQ